MWEKFAPARRSHDMVNAQWLQTHCQYQMEDVITHNSTETTDNFKFGEEIDHVTRHA